MKVNGWTLLAHPAFLEQYNKLITIKQTFSAKHLGDNEMTIADVRELVQYVTNAQGKTISVLVPLEVWEDLLKSCFALANELGQVDEAEPNEQILADLKDSLRQVKAGQTFPIAELWDGIEVRSSRCGYGRN